MNDEPTGVSDQEHPDQPGFWNERFDPSGQRYLFGAEPNAFIAEQAERIPEGSDVVELGAGEGRNLVFLARERGCAVTAVDFAECGLENARRLAERHGVALETIRADVLEGPLNRQWDVVLVTFLQLLPDERPRLYQRIQDLLRPGGLLVAEWFHPDQIRDNYESGGPPTVDRMVTAEELRRHFPEEGRLYCVEGEIVLNEGEALVGKAAVVQLMYRHAAGG